MQTYTGACQIKTVRVAAGEASDHLAVIVSNTLFINPSIDIVPFSPADGSITDFRYQVRVYWQGDIMETHDFANGNRLNVCSMNYPNKVFPPNQAWNVIPGLKGFAPQLLGFEVRITNNENTARDYTVYSTFQMLSAAVYNKIP